MASKSRVNLQTKKEPVVKNEPNKAQAEDKKLEEQLEQQQENAPAQEPTVEPTPEPTPASTPEPVVTPEPTKAPVAEGVFREKTEFEQYIDAVRANGSDRIQSVLTILEDYQKVMGANTVTSEEVINQQQGALWRGIRIVLNTGEDFEKGFQLLINFFRNYNVDGGAFQHRLVFRGFEHTKLNADVARAFQNILTILATAAENKNHDTVRKNVDLALAMNSPAFSDESRSRVIGFFN